MQIVTVHASVIAEDLYVFNDSCTYDQRSEPIATVTAVYSFEGLMVDLKAFRGAPSPSILREIGKYLAERGVVRIEWRRENMGIERAKAYSLIEQKYVEPLFTQI